MACSWITNNTGEVIGALTEDGKKSKLFESLLKQYDVQQAQDLYEASRSDEFKEIYQNTKNYGKTRISGFSQETPEQRRRRRERWDESRGSQTLEGAPIYKNYSGAIPELVSIAEDYAQKNNINYNRQSKYVEVDVERAMRIADVYDEMLHEPQNPIVKEAYQNLIAQTIAQYKMLEEAGYAFYFFDENNDPYEGKPVRAMIELKENRTMGSYMTEAGFGTGNEGIDISNNPMLQDTGITWGYGTPDGEQKKVLANDLFRVVHDAFGHGLEGAGFRERGEENAWQAHARLFKGSALAAITSETRGQNSYLNFSTKVTEQSYPLTIGEHNAKASVFDTIFAPQKVGLMPEWTWTEGFDKGIELNEEPSIEQVVRFVTEENQSKRELSAEQKVAVRNFGVANTENLKERLSDAFYNNEGVFFVSESKLVNSGLYSAYEASNLKNDISLQEKVKSALEAFKNTSDIYSEDISDDQVDKINTFNSFGKLVKVKKEVEPLQSVETFQEIDGQLVEEPVDNVDLLLSYKSAEENQELEDDLNVLLTVSDEVLLRNEATKTVLENVERLAIADGLDLVGLADKQFDRPFMQSLLDFVISPNKENTANFSQEYKRLFQKNSEVKLTGLNREVDNKEYVVVNTTLSEQEVYKQKGFIKVEDNLYIKTNSQPLEELYEVVRTYTEKYPKEMTLEQYVQQETGKLQGFTNPEIAEAVVLYKMYFEGVNEGVKLLAPNGKISNLNEEQYKIVRTPEFKAWFGDWENDPQNASKVVDENGEPKIMYHATLSDTFYEFDPNKIGSQAGSIFGKGFYFDVNKTSALFYTSGKNTRGKLMGVFLNSKKPINYYSIPDSETLQEDYNVKTKSDFFTKEGRDGIYTTSDSDGNWDSKDQFIVFNPNQIKSATEIKGITSEETNDIRLLKAITPKNQVVNFTGNYEYLTEDFPADFYKEMLAEKKKDSVKYNNYYVHFGIDEKGIYLNEVDSNTLENIKDFTDENMKQYSVISKRIPNIADQTEEVFSTEQTRRDEAINNPNSVEKFTGEYVKTASDNVIAKNTQKEFIKVENEIYELWDDLGNLSMYTKVASNNSPYFAVNTKKTGTNEDLNSYTHLLTTPEKFINYKKNNEVEGFEC